MGSDRYHWDLVSNDDSCPARLAAANAKIAELERELADARQHAQLTTEEWDDLDAILSSLAEQREAAIGFGQFCTADMFRDQHAALAKLLGAKP